MNNIYLEVKKTEENLDRATDNYFWLIEQMEIMHSILCHGQLDPWKAKTLQVVEKIKKIKTRKDKKCPFWSNFTEGTLVDDCIYIQSGHTCEDLEIRPNNPDAWCFKQIKRGVSMAGKERESHKEKACCRAYADARCDACDIAET